MVIQMPFLQGMTLRVFSCLVDISSKLEKNCDVVEQPKAAPLLILTLELPGKVKFIDDI